MAYTIHRTDAYILKSAPQGEANRRIDLLTQDLGVIRGTAQGVRYLKSKLRYSLIDFARVNIALVRGKDVWRIINASKYDDFLLEMPKGYQEIYLKVFSLIGRLVTGEVSEPHIFGLIRSAQIFSIKNIDLSKEELFGFESLIILKLLHHLGYIGDEKILNKFGVLEWNREVLTEAHINRKDIVRLINEALHHSGL